MVFTDLPPYNKLEKLRAILMLAAFLHAWVKTIGCRLVLDGRGTPCPAVRGQRHAGDWFVCIKTVKIGISTEKYHRKLFTLFVPNEFNSVRENLPSGWYCSQCSIINGKSHTNKVTSSPLQAIGLLRSKLRDQTLCGTFTFLWKYS